MNNENVANHNKGINKEERKIRNEMIYTDLALEAREMLDEDEDIELDGVEVTVEENSESDITITTVNIFSDEGSKVMGKAKGKYLTIECEKIKEGDVQKHKEIATFLAESLNKIVEARHEVNDNFTTLLVGLGNENITADSLGPRVIEDIIITRHIFKYTNVGLDKDVFGNVSAIAPGVMGTTGMETSEILKSIIKDLKPNLVIVIDALAARNVKRINTTIQITNTGIYPGSGVGNKRKCLTEESLGVPVIAIGIPTVVNANTLVSDIAQMVNADIDIYENIKSHEEYTNLCVTPKEEDVIVNRLKNIISSGLNIYLHKGIRLEDINDYTY